MDFLGVAEFWKQKLILLLCQHLLENNYQYYTTGKMSKSQMGYNHKWKLLPTFRHLLIFKERYN